MDAARDRALVDAWIRGDRGAGHTLFDHYYEPVARFFFNKVADDVARDLIQRTFVGCLEGLNGFRGDGEFRSWLFGIAYRQLCKHYRGTAGERAHLDFEQVSVADRGSSPSPRVIAGQELLASHGAARRLLVTAEVELARLALARSDLALAATGLDTALRLNESLVGETHVSNAAILVLQVQVRRAQGQGASADASLERARDAIAGHQVAPSLRAAVED